MSTGSIAGISLIALLQVVGGGCGAGDDVLRSVVIGERRLLALNQVSLECIEENQSVGMLTLSYPPNRVLMERRNASGEVNTIEYELCYEVAGDNIPQEVLARTAQDGVLTLVPEARRQDRGATIEYAKFHDVVFRFDTPEGTHRGPERLGRSLATAAGPFHEAFVARAELDQHINGSWHKLTRFRFGGGMGFWPAPQDSIRLRCKFVAQRVRYFSDRVLVDDPVDCGVSNLEFEVVRPDDGYWPPFRDVQPFFSDFKECRLAPGGVLEISYPIKPASVLYTLDVYVRANGKRCSPRLVLVVSGPNMTVPEYSFQLSNWPLAITQADTGQVAGDMGYPGGPLVPEWAAEKLFQLGDGFWGANVQNVAAYTSHFRKRAGLE